jgi:DMSO/TMAO reductase YedYZ molybdopterin-dependent catalytic subunit
MKLSPALMVWLGGACLVAELRGAENVPAPRSSEATARITRAVKAAGGQERLLHCFSFKDRVLIADKDTGFGAKRVSVMDAPRSWWLKTPAGYTERKTEPAKFLVWGWTLGAITDSASTVETIPDVKDDDQELWGLRVSGTVTPPMELYFAKTNDLLARIDWRSDIHRFSDWKIAVGGFKYPARAVGHKKATGKIWYFDDVTEVTPLSELPEQLQSPGNGTK